MEEIEIYAKNLILPLIDYPDDIVIDITAESGIIDIVVKANPEDIGKLIGKNGNNAKAARGLLKAITAKTTGMKLYYSVERE